MATTSTERMATLALKNGNALTTVTDALIVATSTDDKFSIFTDSTVTDSWPKAVVTKLRDQLLAVGATGKVGEVVRIPAGTLASAKVIVAVGVGSARHGITEETLRRAAGSATRSLAGFKKVSLAIPAAYAGAAGALLEGAGLGAYSFTEHKAATLGALKAPVASVTLFTDQTRNAEFKAALVRSRAIVQSVTFARDVINTSPRHLPPAELALAAKDLLTGTSVKVQILDEKALSAGGYGGILAVGMGSTRPPRLIRMEYKPKGATRHVALLGKGITFDTGGISLKPPLNMHEMKGDMSGAAAVIATMHAIATLELPIAVTAYAACAENMPGGGAQRPGDVITAYGGRTVEVLNTDAEGRLVLMDAIVRASEDNPDVMIDIATLTGAAVVALGTRTAGIIGDEAVRTAVKNAADRAGEAFWPMPLPEELREPLNSQVADIANIGKREGGMLSAGWFLKEFVPEGLPWAHLDIAGPAFNSMAPWGYTHRGGVGFGIRTMLAFVEDIESGQTAL